MEQRILQYRKQIDEWLTEMEQNVQTLSQDGEYSTQAIQRQSDTQKTDTEKTDTEEQTMQEMVQDKLQEHLSQQLHFRHGRRRNAQSHHLHAQLPSHVPTCH